MSSDLVFFGTDDGRILNPLDGSLSGWGNQLRGMAVSGALARGVEQAFSALGRPELEPARWTAELFAPVRREPLQVESTVVRQSRRLAVIDGRLIQGGRVVSRANALFLRRDVLPVGEIWRTQTAYAPPPAAMAPIASEQRWYSSGELGWAPGTAVHRNGDVKRSWQRGIRIVSTETTSAFQLVAAVADVANVVTHWGTRGLEFINADFTLSLARTPVADEVGLAAFDRIVHGGAAVGSAHVFDREGVFGIVSVSALCVPDRSADPESLDRPRT